MSATRNDSLALMSIDQLQISYRTTSENIDRQTNKQGKKRWKKAHYQITDHVTYVLLLNDYMHNCIVKHSR